MRGAGWWRGGGHRDLVRRWARLTQTLGIPWGSRRVGGQDLEVHPVASCAWGPHPPHPISGIPEPPPSVHLSTFELGMGKTSLNLLLWPSPGWGQVG